MPYQAPSPPRPTRGKETRLSSGIATNGPMVQREELEFESAETKVAFERAERLANLLSLSYEAMFAWKLNGADQSSFGAPGPSGFTGFLQTRQSGVPATYYCKPNSQSNSRSCTHSFGPSALGRANYVIPARQAGKSL